MTFTLTIDGVAKELKAGSLRISQTANGRATASFTILSEDRSYRPNLRDEVVMEEDGTVIFGGLVDEVTERGMFKGSHPGIQLVISAVDYNAYAERRYVNEAIPAGTLKQALQVVDDYLTPYGVTLDAGQVNGPNLPALDYDYVRLDEVLNQFATLTADFGEPYVWDITPDKKLRMFQPSTEAAPFDLVGNDLPEVIGDIEVSTRLNPGYANKIIIKLAPKREVDRTESWTYGTDPYPFQVQYTVESHYGHLTLSTGGGELMGYTGTSPTQWELDPVTNTLTRTAGTPATGTVYTMMFTGSFAGVYEATASEFATDPWERVIVVDSIPDGTTGQAFADAELAKRLTETKTARYSTWEQGVAAGQAQTINVSARDTNATGMISEVEIRDLVHRLDRRVTTVTDDARTNLGRGWRDVYKAWLGDKAGGGAAVVNTGAGVGSAGPAPPFTSNQYNDNGQFGGKDSWTFRKNADSATLGDEHTISELFVWNGLNLSQFALAESNISVDADAGFGGTAGILSSVGPYSDSWLVTEITPDPVNRVRFRWKQWMPAGSLPLGGGFGTHVVAAVHYANGATFSNSTKQLSINTNHDGTFYVRRGSFGGTDIAGPTASPVWVEDEWNDVEIEVIVSNTDGVVRIWKYDEDGVRTLMLETTGLDTQALGTEAIDGVEFIPQAIDATSAIDDLEINLTHRTLVVGYGHNATYADDALLVGRNNRVLGLSSQAHGEDVEVVGNKSIGINLTDTPRTVTGHKKFHLWADEILFNGVAPGAGSVVGDLADYAFVLKPSDESVTSSTALQDDDHLVFSVGASQTWLVTYVLFWEGAAAGDIKFNWSVPASAVYRFGGLGNITTTLGNDSDVRNVATISSGFDLNFGGAGAANPIMLVLQGVVVTAGTSGSVQLRWAQDGSSGTPTKVLTRSYVEARRVA